MLSVCWHPSGGSVITGGADGTIRRCEAHTGKFLFTMTSSGNNTRVWAVDVLSYVQQPVLDHRRLAVSLD